MLGHAERQRQRDRSAHAAPQDNRLVAVVDRLSHPEHAEHRQQSEDDDRTGGQCGDDDDEQQQDVDRREAFHETRDQDGGQEEDERSSPEGDLLPDRMEKLPAGRLNAGRAVKVEHSARTDDGNNGGNINELVAQHIGAVGQCQAQGHLCQRNVAHDRQKGNRDPAKQCTHDDAAGERAAEGNGGFADGHGLVTGQHVQQDDEDHDGGSIVQQALAFHDTAEPRRRANVPEDGDNGNRVRRGDNRTQQQAGDQRDVGERKQRCQRIEGKADKGCCDEDGDNRHQQDRGNVLDDPSNFQSECGLKQKDWQKNVEDHLRIQRGIDEDVRNSVEGIRFGSVAQIDRQNADHGADRGQQNAGRQPKPSGKGLQQGNRNQEQRESACN